LAGAWSYRRILKTRSHSLWSTSMLTDRSRHGRSRGMLDLGPLFRVPVISVAVMDDFVLVTYGSPVSLIYSRLVIYLRPGQMPRRKPTISRGGRRSSASCESGTGVALPRRIFGPCSGRSRNCGSPARRPVAPAACRRATKRMSVLPAPRSWNNRVIVVRATGSAPTCCEALHGGRARSRGRSSRQRGVAR
jgi:hypothetical protein